MYGACDQQFGSWYEAPEWYVAPYVRMLQRLEAEQSQRLIEALLYSSQRAMNDGDGRAYLRRLERQAAGDQRVERAPKITLAFAELLGAQVKGAPEGNAGASTPKRPAKRRPAKRPSTRKGGEQTT